jgi:SAM-dependent methyltransferase
MEKEEYRKHFELEEDFWWFAGKRAMIGAVLSKQLPARLGVRMLDIGCGTGFNLIFFQDYFDGYGGDLSSEALYYAKKRNLKKLVQADAPHLPFKDESFAFISLLDVLYHQKIESDIAVLRDVHRVLNKDGLLLITDSAFQFLQSRHDLALHARERYTTKTLTERLSAGGFLVKKISYFNFFLFPGIALVRRIQRRDSSESQALKSNLKAASPLLNSLLLSILRFEAFLVKRFRLPWGSSIICLAKKSTDSIEELRSRKSPVKL